MDCFRSFHAELSRCPFASFLKELNQTVTSVFRALPPPAHHASARSVLAAAVAAPHQHASHHHTLPPPAHLPTVFTTHPPMATYAFGPLSPAKPAYQPLWFAEWTGSCPGEAKLIQLKILVNCSWCRFNSVIVVRASTLK